eukprot:1381439-Amorphochlora_amoeboformis.AAC.2
MHLQRWTSAVSDPRFSLGRLKGGFTGEVSNTEDKVNRGPLVALVFIDLKYVLGWCGWLQGENVAIDLLDPAVRPHAQRIREKELSNDSKEIFQRRKESVEKVYLAGKSSYFLNLRHVHTSQVPDFWMMALTGHPETRKAIRSRSNPMRII